MDTLFAYGTLQHPEICTRVIGRMPVGHPARLEEYARYTVRREDFPGIVRQPGALTDGTLLQGITSEEWLRLDKYESDLYVREQVRVRLADGSIHEAFAYVIPDANRDILTEFPWELNHYRPPPPSTPG